MHSKTFFCSVGAWVLVLALGDKCGGARLAKQALQWRDQ